MTDITPDEIFLLSHIIDFLAKNAKEIALPDFPTCETNKEKSMVLSDRISKCDSLWETLKQDRNALDQVLTRVRMELISSRADCEEVQAQLADLAGQLKAIIEDLKQLKEARQNVGKISQEEFAYLKNLRRPPQVLVQMLIGVATLFGIKQDWADVQRFLLQMETKDKIMQFDPLKCDKQNNQDTVKWMESHRESFDPKRILHASKTFFPLAVWLQCTVRMSATYQDMRDLPKRKEFLSGRVKEMEANAQKGKELVLELESIEKKVQNISLKQSELKDTLKNQRKEFAVRRSLLPEDEEEKELVKLRRRDSYRTEYPTQVFVNWKSMMVESPKKKKKRKSTTDEPPRRLSQVDRLILKDAWSRESETLARPEDHVRKLTGIKDDVAEQIWMEGEGWVDMKSADQNKEKKANVKDDEKKSLEEDDRSGEQTKGLLMSLRSEKQAEKKAKVKSLSGFLKVVSDRLDEIQN